MSTAPLLAIGLDVGTGGARALAVALDGRVLATARADFPASATHARGACIEQDPRAWTEAAERSLRQLMKALGNPVEIAGISADATSGTFLLVDAENRPLTPGIMYNDLRAESQTPRCAEALRPVLAPYGIEMAASFALPKILHLAETQPALFARCRRIVHQTDWILGGLCGRYDISDVSTALKTGADIGQATWPAAIENILGIPRERLPRLVLPGARIGEVTSEASAATGLPAGTPVFSGCTDGTAGCLASGAGQPGDLNVTLGTTLVFKAVADQPVLDPQGVIYNHRHPAGGYLPGAASSTGAEWIGARVGSQADLDALGLKAASLIPTRHVVYPLVRGGERFPFACSAAKGFGWDQTTSAEERFAAGMEGVAYLERLGIERFGALGFTIGDRVYATGGAVAGETWLRIRAAVNRKNYLVPEHPECAMGAAILAAANSLGGTLPAIRKLVRLARQVEPDDRLAAAYAAGFERFREELRSRGYL